MNLDTQNQTLAVGWTDDEDSDFQSTITQLIKGLRGYQEVVYSTDDQLMVLFTSQPEANEAYKRLSNLVHEFQRGYVRGRQEPPIKLGSGMASSKSE